MDIKQIRLNNALRIIAELGITKSEFARRMNKAPQNVIGYLVQNNSNRNIGHKMARTIEETFNKPNGWLDKEGLDTPKVFNDNSCKAVYSRASSDSFDFIKARKNWLDNRSIAVSKITQDFKQWLAEDELEILPPVDPLAQRFDYILSKGQFSLNLFIPFYGFNQWVLPELPDEQPDFLAIALMPENDTSEVSYFILTKPEYLEIVESLESDYLDIAIKGTGVAEDYVYLKLVVHGGEDITLESTSDKQRRKLGKKHKVSRLKLSSLCDCSHS